MGSSAASSTEAATARPYPAGRDPRIRSESPFSAEKVVSNVMEHGAAVVIRYTADPMGGTLGTRCELTGGGFVFHIGGPVFTP
jgi:hypothetical protein